MTEPVPDVVARVSAAARQADGVDPLDEATHRRLARRGLDGVDLWTSDQAGFALRYDGALDLAVDPDSRGRGIGARLAPDAVAAAGPLTAWSHCDHPAARILAERHGFARTRALWVMRRSASDPLPDQLLEAAATDGTTIRGYAETDRAELLRVNGAAFAHHPEQGGMDDADLADRMAADWFDPAGLLVADTGETPLRLAGFHWTKRHDVGLGEVYVVGVDPAAQGGGLGRRLTLAGLRHLHEVGVAEVLLYVESDNAPAISVYSRLGFTHAERDTHVQYLRA